MIQKTANYSFRWADRVRRDYFLKYPRATAKVGEIYSITDEMVTKWIANSPVRWNSYKHAVKIWYNWQRKQPIPDENVVLLNKRIVSFRLFLSERVFRH